MHRLYNSKKLETAKISANKEMDKYMWYRHLIKYNTAGKRDKPGIYYIIMGRFQNNAEFFLKSEIQCDTLYMNKKYTHTKVYM